MLDVCLNLKWSYLCLNAFSHCVLVVLIVLFYFHACLRLIYVGEWHCIKVFSSLVVFLEGCRSGGPTVCWHTSRRLLRRRKHHMTVAAAVVVPPLVDAVMHLRVAVDARPYVEELRELKARVQEHHHCP
jgi:hypothetical protein